MMRIKCIIASFLTFLLFYNGKSQYAIAGVPGSIYVDVVPDTLLSPIPKSWTNESYDLDINQDGTNDIRIDTYNGYSPGGGLFYSSAASLDTARVKLSFLRYDSTQYYPSCGAGWFYFAVMLKPYLLTDTIKNGKYVNSGDLAKSGYSVNCYSYGDGLWVTSSDEYIGIRFDNSGLISYGWIRVNVSSISTTLVKDFSLGAPVNGLSEMKDEGDLYVFPNPAHDILTLQTKKDVYTMKIYDTKGQPVLERKGKSAREQIDVSMIQNGMYFLNLQTTEGVLIKKIIIQH